MIDWLHTQKWAILHLFEFFHFGMSDGKIGTKSFGFPKELIVYSNLKRTFKGLRHSKPHQLNKASAIRKVCNKPALRTFSDFLNHHNAPAKLNVLHSLYDVCNAMNFCAVFVSIRIGVQQISHRVDAEL